MKKLLGILILLVVAGCHKPAFTTSHGTHVYLKKNVCLTKESVEEATEHFRNQIEELGIAQKQEFLSTLTSYGMVIHIHGEPIEMGGNLYSGLQQGVYLTVYYPGCYSNSAFFHEIGHYLREFTYHEWWPDLAHKDRPFWTAMDRTIPQSFAEHPLDCIDLIECDELVEKKHD